MRGAAVRDDRRDWLMLLLAPLLLGLMAGLAIALAVTGWGREGKE